MGDIVVTGVRADSPEDFSGLGGMSRFDGGDGQYSPDNVSTNDDGNGSSKGVFEVLQDFVKYILEKYFDKVVKSQEQSEQDERTITSQFDPTKVSADGTFTTNNGQTGRMWAMSDGTVFWDTNGNGKPDFHSKFGSDGKFYGDDGSGFGLLE